MDIINELKQSDADIILNCITDGVITIDLKQRVRYINKAAREMLGYSEEDLLGKTCDTLFQCNICHSMDCILKRTLNTKEAVSNFEAVIKNTTGKPIPVNINTALLKDNDENLVGIVEVFRDISLIKELQERLDLKYSFENIVGKNKRMEDIFALLPSIAHSKSTVLIEGESGTGKELIANAIHISSPRKDKPFIKVSCAALAEGVLESELFGHVKGSFTGAFYEKPGRFELADRGTIFLDDVGDISPYIQVKFLRVLQEEEFERVGGTKTIKVDVRVIAATNKNLASEVKKGTFREDLYYRLRVVPIYLPPLREKRNDIPLLLNHFIGKFNKIMDKNINNISHKAMDILMSYDYPGNIRELENIIEHAFVCCNGNTILMEHLPKEILQADADLLEKVDSREGSLGAMEKELILRLLDRHEWRYKDVSERLGISRTTLWRKLKELGIQKPQTVSE
jgi:PAS domain S-box-containing protein